MKKTFLFLLSIFTIVFIVNAGVVNSKGTHINGNWSSSGSWDTGVPGVDDTVFIAASDTLTIDLMADVHIKKLNISGKIINNNGLEVQGNLLIDMGATIDINTTMIVGGNLDNSGSIVCQNYLFINNF